MVGIFGKTTLTAHDAGRPVKYCFCVFKPWVNIFGGVAVTRVQSREERFVYDDLIRMVPLLPDCGYVHAQ